MSETGSPPSALVESLRVGRKKRKGYQIEIRGPDIDGFDDGYWHVWWPLDTKPILKERCGLKGSTAFRIQEELTEPVVGYDYLMAGFIKCTRMITGYGLDVDQVRVVPFKKPTKGS